MKLSLQQQIVIGVITVLVGTIITIGSGWVNAAGEVQSKHESAIAVLNSRADQTDRTISEIKAGQLRIENKLDRLLERTIK